MVVGAVGQGDVAMVLYGVGDMAMEVYGVGNGGWVGFCQVKRGVGGCRPFGSAGSSLTSKLLSSACHIVTVPLSSQSSAVVLCQSNDDEWLVLCWVICCSFVVWLSVTWHLDAL